MEAERPAFYALAPGGWRDLVTILHPPYTLWHLSYVAIGSAAAPQVHWSRLGWALLAFFCAVGLGAHALDELNGRPLGTRLIGSCAEGDRASSGSWPRWRSGLPARSSSRRPLSR